MAHTTDMTDSYDVYLAGEDNYWDTDLGMNFNAVTDQESAIDLNLYAFVDDRPIWERIRDQKAETEAIAELDRLSVEIIDCQLDGVQDDDPDYVDITNRFWALHNDWAV